MRTCVDNEDWTLTDDERGALAAGLDALLPAEGSFPAPSATDIIEAFILARVPAAGRAWVPYPGLDEAGLRAVIAALRGQADASAALEQLEREQPELFLAFWRLAVYGYYSR